MQRFAALFEKLDTTTSTNAKVDAMVDYFRSASASDAAWAVYVLIGRRLKRAVGPALLRAWLKEEVNLPGWLIDETYGSVGDLAETVALLIPSEESSEPYTDVSLTEWFLLYILPLGSQSTEERRNAVVAWWRRLPYRECFLVTKLLTGSLRVGVSRTLVTRALAEYLNQPKIHIERALIGEWVPNSEFWDALIRNESNLHVAQPYPFFLASPLAVEVGELGRREEWLAEWKWDGIRGQIVRRAGHTVLWSRGEEIVTDRFPEITLAANLLPDGTVLDGEILAWQDNRVLPFAHLQRRLGRRKLNPKILLEFPARFVAYDLLELQGCDVRTQSLRERRRQLARALPVTAAPIITLSPEVSGSSWDELATSRSESRSHGVEGLMLKHWESHYGAGRQRGSWWKWKIDPFVFEGVLLYAAPGHGRRSNLYTDYTFGVWHDDSLVPVAKAYSGLTDVEIARLDKWIRAHTKEKFGIVRSVEPVHVFELAYEGIAHSSRHKSGLALRFPRILQWRTDKPSAEADTLATLQQVLASSLACRLT